MDLLDSARTSYDDDGFVVSPPLLRTEVVEAATAGIQAVIEGEYETGRPPRLRQWSIGDDPRLLIKIAEPHLSNHAIRRLITDPEIARWAAALSDSTLVQVWAVDLLVKMPSGGEESANVGWHQDASYGRYWDGEIFTAWIALSDMSEASAPLRYVCGSHRLGLVEGGDFYITHLSALRERMKTPDDFTWDEVPVVVPRGGVAFHHRLTVHASGPNLSNQPRVAVAVRLRTDRCRLREMADVVSHLDDDFAAPVVYGSR